MASVSCTARFVILDKSRNQVRFFYAEVTYQPKCGNNMHQFGLEAPRCACGLEVAR